MALPTLRPYFTGVRRSAQAEKQIIQRRNREEDFRQAWEENSKFFSKSDMRVNKLEAWSSPQSHMDSMAAYERRGQAEQKKKRLLERREKLASLLAEERDHYEVELKGYSPDQLSSMRARAEQLKQERLEIERKVAEEKLEELRRLNCPELRQLESRQMQRVVQDEWKEQLERKEKDEESARLEKERYALAMEEERQAALKLQEEEEAHKKRVEQEHVRALQQQMAEIKLREEEAGELEYQQGLLLRKQMELEKVEEERKALMEAQKRADLGRVLLRQHKAQMKRKSRQIQEALELDMKILESLAMQEQEEASLRSARRQAVQADIQWMKQVIAEQMELEKCRDQELELLYQEEAARMWRKREEEWEREQRARERLMNEVLCERQKQIRLKLESVKEQQAESIQRREELLQHMELAHQMTAREAHHKDREREERKEELTQQMKEKKRQAHREEQLDALELARLREREVNYDQYVKKQEEQLQTHRYSPKFHGRRKAAWY